MLNARFVAIYGTIGLLVMVVLLALIFFKLVPEYLYLPFSVFAIALFLGRMALRVMLARKERRLKQAGTEPGSTPTPKP